MDVNSDDNDNDNDDDEDEEEDESDASKPPSPRVREEEEPPEPERPRFGGIGSFTKAGIGSAPPLASPAPTKPPPPDLPSAFRTQRSFVRGASPSASKPATPLPAHEQAHFSKIGGTIGAQMLAKMGWQAGTGLGATGEGIVIPIESKLRPKNMGIAFKGYKEKTEQSKLEARRRGEVVSEDEEEIRPGRRKKDKEQQEKRSEVWKKQKKVKTKIEHKTYEQIVAEAGQEPSAPNLGQIIDATGRTPREVASLADISMSSWTSSTDPTRIPEVRHNIRLIAQACKTDLDELAREAKALEERKKFIAQEDARLRKKVADEAELIARLQQVTLAVDEISSQAKELASVYEASLDAFSPLFSRLLLQFPAEFERYRLDEIVVAAIAPIVRRTVAQWNPLHDPFGLVTTFRTWKQALKINTPSSAPQTQVDVYGTRTVAPPAPVEQPMTPFESLLWNVWLPRVRTVLNNDWAPADPQPAVRLYEAWATFLPPFIRDNMLDQLVLPKVSKAVADWRPARDAVPLQTLVFPWLPHLGLRVEDVLGEARRKIKSVLRSWTPPDAAPPDLRAWQPLFDAPAWDALVLKHVVPKLSAHLRAHFRVNPRAQDMAPLEAALAWAPPLLRGAIVDALLEAEFFPKWLRVLHVWLVQPRVSFEEVARWYEFWRGCFPAEVLGLPGVARGFTRGLQLMNTAIELGPDAPAKLPHPDTSASTSDSTTAPPPGTPKTKPKQPPARVQEVTFRALVEEFAAAHNLLFVPAGRAHERSRMPLFRVSASVGGRGGLLVYIQDDAGGGGGGGGEEYRAITLEEMVLRANKAGGGGGGGVLSAPTAGSPCELLRDRPL
ncbi:TFP11-domain-containing protein [Leucogyrophana mollusca]|uniref:TFP11-domain-containing protein n=1 Tax=Leucogyrophana mollusca TaxID=85980 RepID=A0ACB8BR63_9AGAM|nr:TFP11-domain-containing protein [Leucogyrophana mollusca]